MMSSSPTPGANSDSTFFCGCGEEFRSACDGAAFYKEHEGKRYCVLHYPSREKIEDFQVALQKKLHTQDLNFRGVWFPHPLAFGGESFAEATFFTGAYFSDPISFIGVSFKQKIDFSQATFESRVEFRKVKFEGDSIFSLCMFGNIVEFNELKFNYGQFDKVIFNFGATFHTCVFEDGANFSRALFNYRSSFREVNFKALTTFDSAEFRKAIEFHKVTFGGAAFFMSTTFSDYVRFSSDNHSLDFATTFTSFAQAKFEKSEKVTFDTLRLSPSWFMNVDVRKFEFINIMWMDLYDLYDKTRKPIPDEIALITRTQAITKKVLNAPLLAAGMAEPSCERVRCPRTR